MYINSFISLFYLRSGLDSSSGKDDIFSGKDKSGGWVRNKNETAQTTLVNGVRFRCHRSHSMDPKESVPRSVSHQRDKNGSCESIKRSF